MIHQVSNAGIRTQDLSGMSLQTKGSIQFDFFPHLTAKKIELDLNQWDQKAGLFLQYLTIHNNEHLHNNKKLSKLVQNVASH